MKNNKMLEYNLKLNQEYFFIEYRGNWKLHRNKYYIYEVMNSENNTEEELKKFIKEHKTYDYTMVAGLKSIIMCGFLLVLALININLNLVEISYFMYGAWFVLLIELLVRTLVNSHNNKVKDKICQEDMEFLEKKKKEILEEMEKKHVKKRNIPKNKENK